MKNFEIAQQSANSPTRRHIIILEYTQTACGANKPAGAAGEQFDRG